MSNRDALLEAAERCLRVHGYSTTTARDLASEAGTSLAAIGYHFGSKEALLNEALGVAFAGWLDRLGAVALGLAGQPFDEVVRRLLEAVYEAIDEDRLLLAAFFDAVAQSTHSAPLRAQLATQYEATRRGIAELVAALVPASRLHEETGPAVGSLIIAIIDGLAVQHLLDPAAVPAPAALGYASSLLGPPRPAKAAPRKR